MGTTYHIKVVQPAAQQRDSILLQQLIDQRLRTIDQLMSTYKENSEISRFNRGRTNNWTEVSPETYLVVSEGQQISALSSGAFDMTVGTLVDLWGFGPTFTTSAVPAREDILKARQECGYGKLELRPRPPALKKTEKQLRLDLSAIAKGYAVDAVARLLKDNGFENFLVEIGGEIISAGQKADKSPWIIGIERPEAGQRSVQKLVPLVNAAMATSGDYRNYFEHQGVRYSHTIDPTTGYPITHRLASVTVISETCMRADALATALMVMGPDKGLKFAEQQNLAVVMLVKANNGFVEKQSRAFTDYLNRNEF